MNGIKRSQITQNNIQTSRTFNTLSALMAFLLWGGWSYYINHNDVDYSGIISGFTQGTASLMITLFMLRFVTYLYHQYQHPIAKQFMPAMITVSLTSLCLVSIHTLIDTPNIVYTIAPALSVAFIFCLYTSFKLHKINQLQGYNQ